MTHQDNFTNSSPLAGNTPAAEPTRTVWSRDGQWAYELRADNGRVVAVTHLPTARTIQCGYRPVGEIPLGDSMSLVRRRIRTGVLLAALDGHPMCEYGMR